MGRILLKKKTNKGWQAMFQQESSYTLAKDLEFGCL